MDFNVSWIHRHTISTKSIFLILASQTTRIYIFNVKKYVCRNPNEVNKSNITEEEEDVKFNEIEEDFEALPPIVEEGKDFRNELPDRLYLDSDPEFHLNVHIVFSYLLLYQIDSHILMVVRRIITIYLLWMMIGSGVFIYLKYYPLLLDGPILKYQYNIVVYPVYEW